MSGASIKLTDARELLARDPASFPREPDKETTVYVIQGGGFVKIGMARNVKERLKLLQTGNPHKLSVYFTLTLEHRESAESVEQFAHEHLKQYRHHGEWFSCEPHLAKGAVMRGVPAYEWWEAT